MKEMKRIAIAFFSAIGLVLIVAFLSWAFIPGRTLGILLVTLITQLVGLSFLGYGIYNSWKSLSPKTLIDPIKELAGYKKFVEFEQQYTTAMNETAGISRRSGELLALTISRQKVVLWLKGLSNPEFDCLKGYVKANKEHGSYDFKYLFELVGLMTSLPLGMLPDNQAVYAVVVAAIGLFMGLCISEIIKWLKIYHVDNQMYLLKLAEAERLYPKMAAPQTEPLKQEKPFFQMISDCVLKPLLAPTIEAVMRQFLERKADGCCRPDSARSDELNGSDHT